MSEYLLDFLRKAIYHNEDNTYRFSKKDFDKLWDHQKRVPEFKFHLNPNAFPDGDPINEPLAEIWDNPDDEHWNDVIVEKGEHKDEV